MNIICNNCVGGRLYEVRKEQFSNPFIWERIEHSDFIYLIKNFEIIDFTNVKFSLEYYKSKDYQNVLCKVDNKISIHFTHYVYDNEIDTLTKRNLDILYKDIIKYCKEKYFTRLSRMNSNPIFVYSLNGFYYSDEEYNKRIKDISLILNKNIYIITYLSKQINIELPNNIKVVYVDDNIMNSTTAAIAKNIENNIIDNE